MNPVRIMALAQKEVIQIIRDPRALALAFILPMILLFLFGYAITLDIKNIPFGVLDYDKSNMSRNLTLDFVSSNYFNHRFDIRKAGQIDSLIQLGEARIVLVIPPDFSEKLKQGRTADLQVIVDGADANTANIAIGYTESIVGARNQKMLAEVSGRSIDPPVNLEIRFWYNPNLRSQNYIIPGLIALIMTVVSALLTSLTIAREWERGTMEQIITTPVTSLELAIGKLIPYFVIAIIDVIIATAVGTIIYDIPFRGNLLTLLGFSSLFLFAVLGVGFLISVATKSQQVAYQAAMLASFLPTFLFSGFLFPISSMPKWLQYITLIIPARYYVTIARDLFLKGAGFRSLYIEGLVLLGFAVFMVFASAMKFKKRLGN
ncbi:MAG TPA: ABC transporter permease [candidate division Zixibacteria bacterium]|nr:ABC transporter permease [candidate division Zixibacteria bacterium]